MVHLYRALEEVQKYKEHTRCSILGKRELLNINGYIRRRLRVAMIHDHPTQRKGWLMTTNWNNEFFLKIGLVPSFWYCGNQLKQWTKESYLAYLTKKNKRKSRRKIERLKEKGQEYYTPDRLAHIARANS